MSDVVPPNPMGPTVRSIRLFHDRLFDLGQPLVRVHVIERAEQLLLCVQVSRRAIAADADANGARTASLPLRLPHRVQDALPDAFERAIGATKMIEVRRQRVLRVGVLAASALENQLDLDLRLRATGRSG